LILFAYVLRQSQHVAAQRIYRLWIVCTLARPGTTAKSIFKRIFRGTNAIVESRGVSPVGAVKRALLLCSARSCDASQRIVNKGCVRRYAVKMPRNLSRTWVFCRAENSRKDFSRNWRDGEWATPPLRPSLFESQRASCSLSDWCCSTKRLQVKIADPRIANSDRWEGFARSFPRKPLATPVFTGNRPA
jgi:hypothetical protein